MSPRISRVLFLLGVACFASSALADDNYEGVVRTPFGPGGLRLTVSMPSFNRPVEIGTVVADGYKIPFSRNPRPGCFVGSPTLAIGHADGDGQFIPSLHVTWQGVYYPATAVWPNVFRLELRIGPAGNERAILKTYASAAIFQNTALFYPTPDSILYRGEFDQSLAGFNFETSGDVKTNEEIHVWVCDLTPTSSMTIRQLIFQSFPFETP